MFFYIQYILYYLVGFITTFKLIFKLRKGSLSLGSLLIERLLHSLLIHNNLLANNNLACWIVSERKMGETSSLMSNGKLESMALDLVVNFGSWKC